MNYYTSKKRQNYSSYTQILYRVHSCPANSGQINNPIIGGLGATFAYNFLCQILVSISFQFQLELEVIYLHAPPIPFLSFLSVPPPNFELYYIILTQPSLYLLLVYIALHWGPVNHVNRVISLSLKVTSMTWIWNKNSSTSTSLTDWQIILKHSPNPSFMLSCAGNNTNRINRGKFKSSTREQTGKKKKKKKETHWCSNNINSVCYNKFE